MSKPLARRATPAAWLVPAAIVLSALPATMGAQARYSLTPYAASDQALPGAPSVYGLGITSWSGVLGIRVSGALGDLRTTVEPDGIRRTHPGAWTADADLVLSPGQSREWRAAFGGLAPSGFVGFGTHGMRTDAGERLSAPTWSWGGALAVGLVGPLAVESEARWRHPIETYQHPLPTGFADGWEYRIGLRIDMGGGRRRRGGNDDWPSSGSRTRLPGRVSWPSGGSGSSSSSRASAGRVVNTADDYVGTPYVYGGTTPDGFDCSGFVQYVYRRNGVTLPRTSREQAYAGDGVSASVTALRTGDLIFFSTHGERIDHVAIYAGNRRIIHSTSSGGGVRFDDLSTSRGRWFVEHMVAARRVLDAGGAGPVRSFTLPEGITIELDPPDLAPRPSGR